MLVLDLDVDQVSSRVARHDPVYLLQAPNIVVAARDDRYQPTQIVGRRGFLQIGLKRGGFRAYGRLKLHVPGGHPVPSIGGHDVGAHS